MIYQTNTTVCDWMWLLIRTEKAPFFTVQREPGGPNCCGGFLQVIGVEKLRRRTNGDWLERPGFSNDTEHLLVRLFVESTIWIFFFFSSSCRRRGCCCGCCCCSIFVDRVLIIVASIVNHWKLEHQCADPRMFAAPITKLPLRGDTRTPPRSALWRIPLISSSVTRGCATCGEGRLGGLNILGTCWCLKVRDPWLDGDSKRRWSFAPCHFRWPEATRIRSVVGFLIMVNNG